jgi:DNA invertase Pin-like site-specific DNA recombinase
MALPIDFSVFHRNFTRNSNQTFFGMLIGYARVSTRKQNLELQLDALQKAGCQLIYQEQASGAKADREELDKMLGQLRKGDTVVVWKIDRIGRSLRHLVSLIDQFQQLGVGFRSLSDSIDTTTAQGRLVFNIFASLAEFERELISERTNAGLDNARRKGKRLGRPAGLSQERLRKASAARDLHHKGYSKAEIARMLDIGLNSVYRYLKYQGIRN